MINRNFNTIIRRELRYSFTFSLQGDLPDRNAVIGLTKFPKMADRPDAMYVQTIMKVAQLAFGKENLQNCFSPTRSLSDTDLYVYENT